MSFDKAFADVLGKEGAYSNNTKDTGGETMWGITVRVARAFGYKDAMKDMPLSVAKVIYKKQYWDVLQLDAIDDLSEELAHKLFDQAVNIGTGWTGRTFQRLLNVLNRNQRDYADIPVDGQVGAVTLYALKGLIAKRGKDGAKTLLIALKGLQVERYVSIAEANSTQEEFAYGWISKRVTEI